jgi:hypothetical protein
MATGTAPPPILGSVSATVGGVPALFTLRADRLWEVEHGGRIPDALLDGVMFQLQEVVDAHAGPSDGFFGPRQLRQAADLLGGTAHVLPIDHGPPGLIY